MGIARGGHRRFGRCRIRDVAGNRETIDLGRDLIRRRLVDIENGDLGAGSGQSPRRSGAKTRPAARDQCRQSICIHFSVSLF